VRETMSFLPGVDGMIKALEEKVYLSKKAEEEEAAGFSGGSQVSALSAREPHLSRLAEGGTPQHAWED
jgi:hypothetical protein